MKYRLDELCDYIARGIAPKYSDGSSFCVLNQKCIRNNDVHFINSRRHNDVVKRVSPDKTIRLYDILVNSTGVGTAGRVAQLKTVPKDYSGITADSHITIIRPNPKRVYPEFLGYFLQNRQSYIETLAKGSTGQTEISRDSIANIEVDLPDLETQKKIVHILSSLDRKTKLNNQNNKTLKEIAEALFKKQFAVKIYGDKTISDYILPKRGKPLLSKDAREGSIPVVAGGLEPAAYHNQSNTMDPVITISASGANAGFTRLWGEKVWSSDSSYIDSSITDNIYFWYVLLKTRQKEIYDAQTGSAQAHIYPKHIGDMPIGFIDNEEIIEYNKRVKPLFEKIFKNEFENKTLLSLRDTILPKLLSGEINIDKVMFHE